MNKQSFSTNKSKIRSHTIWHFILTVFVYEIIHLMWLVVGIMLSLGGLAVFTFVETPFYKMAIGGPIFLAGGSIAIFNFSDVIFLAFDLRRVKSLCVFCS